MLLGSLAAGCVGYGLIATAVAVHDLPLHFAASFLGGLTEANISIAQSSIADTASPADRNRLAGGLLAAVVIQLPLLVFAAMAQAGTGRLWLLRRSRPALSPG